MPRLRPARRNGPATGLFLNGNRWWYRVLHSDGERYRRSTGTKNVQLANSIVSMLTTLREQPGRPNADLVDAAAEGRLALDTLYTAYLAPPAQQALAVLRAQLGDLDLEPYVAQWERTLVSRDLSAKVVVGYTTHVRSLFSEGEPLLRSVFTADTVQDWLDAIPYSTSTKRRYFDSMRSFAGFLCKRGVLDESPLDQLDPPSNNPPSEIYYEHADVRRVLDRMSGEAREWMTLAFGTGMEAGAITAARGLDVNVDHRTVFARGTKNVYRARACFVDAWAWETVRQRAARTLPTTPLFTLSIERVRAEFYAAQVAAGLRVIGEDGKPTQRWHTIHAARHSFCVNRILGTDGEPARDLQYCADQLGHADTTMVSKIYGKFRLRERADAERAHQATRELHTPSRLEIAR